MSNLAQQLDTLLASDGKTENRQSWTLARVGVQPSSTGTACLLCERTNRLYAKQVSKHISIYTMYKSMHVYKHARYLYHVIYTGAKMSQNHRFIPAMAWVMLWGLASAWSPPALRPPHVRPACSQARASRPLVVVATAPRGIRLLASLERVVGWGAKGAGWGGRGVGEGGSLVRRLGLSTRNSRER